MTEQWPSSLSIDGKKTTTKMCFHEIHELVNQLIFTVLSAYVKFSHMDSNRGTVFLIHPSGYLLKSLRPRISLPGVRPHLDKLGR
ncbi:hypothetical protein I7I50_10300 [Histoplasma capsulatum G186AR]|uniref:Uncharacterized protein n=1 Tax=Ajellomyces capsulatus TaxID=5037 RepID=A0A8H7Z6I6_AJECA|nr:hypothetical protein I7I52_01539 [Histoplasma capsulatum]QSS69118.1 hypothetical protein I7I50_10300 [Histoplasma capsulatum G186AR]